jgi:hypothetical protein
VFNQQRQTLHIMQKMELRLTLPLPVAMVSVVVLVVVHTLSHFCLVRVTGTFWHAWSVQQTAGRQATTHNIIGSRSAPSSCLGTSCV